LRQPALVALLPWLNGDGLSDREVRRRLAVFLRSFDGSAAAGHLRVYAEAGHVELRGGPRPPAAWAEHSRHLLGYEAVPRADGRALERVRDRTLALVRRGFRLEDGQPASPGPRVDNLTSLRVGLRRVAPEAQRLSRAARQRYRAEPGAYETWVDGELRDLVPYLVARVLTLPGAAALGRCPAPERGQRDGKCCGRLFVMPRTGRPRKFCSGACKVRAFAMQDEGRMAPGRKGGKR
jgi:hypothetical protein